MARRKPPEVFEFQEPVYSKARKDEPGRRKRFLEGDVFKSPAATGLSQGKSKNADVEVEGVRLNLKETLREVQTFAFSNLKSRKAKRKRDEEQLQSLGAKPAKSDYVPYSHYMNEMKARKDKEKRIAEELHIPLKKKKQQKKRLVRGKGRWKDSIKSLEPEVGKFRGGVLKLSKRDISKYSK